VKHPEKRGNIGGHCQRIRQRLPKLPNLQATSQARREKRRHGQATKEPPKIVPNPSF